MARRLIVNADDLGMTPGVTRGIVESMTSGIVSSTSVMINMPSAPGAVALAMEHRLPVGLHLNLTTGKPLSPPSKVSSLVQPDGWFHARSEFVRRLLSLRISMADVHREFSAQIETARRMGIEPTHLDTHHHLQLWLPVTLALLRAGRSWGIRKARTTRTTDMAVRIAGSGTLRGWAKRRYKAVTAAILKRRFLLPTWRMEASAFRDGKGMGGAFLIEEWMRLVRKVETLPDDHIVEVPCHPALVDDELRRYAQYVDDREREKAVLESAGLKRAISEAGIRLISFRDY